MNKLIKNIALYTSLSLATIGGLKSYYIVDQTQQAVVSTFQKRTGVVLNVPQIDENKKATEVKQITADIQKFCTDNKKEMPKIYEGAGIHFKWPWQSVTYLDNRLLAWDGYPEEITTKDKRFLSTTSTARWRINNPYIYMTQVKTENAGHSKLDNNIDGIVRDQISMRDATEAIRSSNRKMEVTDKDLDETDQVGEIYVGREGIRDKIKEESKKQCLQFGIEVHDFQIVGIVYVGKTKERIEEKMRSERERVAKKYISEGVGEANKILGEMKRENDSIMSAGELIAKTVVGDAKGKATRIYAEGFKVDKDFYELKRKSEILQGAPIERMIIDKDNTLIKPFTYQK
jgi:membrane protease subunit HflC